MMMTTTGIRWGRKMRCLMETRGTGKDVLRAKSLLRYKGQVARTLENDPRSLWYLGIRLS